MARTHIPITGRQMTDCPPRWATSRTARETSGEAVAAVAATLGLGLLPWQRQVLDAALERHDGRAAYRDVCVSIPRQSGKSSLALALMVEKMVSTPGARVLYAAQSRAAAREKLLSSWWPLLARSPFADELTLFRGYGAETVTADNGSSLQLLSATEASGHGETTDLVVVDEAWVHGDARVEQAVRPTMATKRDAQLWAMSTAGTYRSVWWRQKLDAARAAAEMGMTESLACFEWSAPDNANFADESTWWASMPALGHLIDVETVRDDLANMALTEFARAFLNVWPDPAGEGWQVIARDRWEASAL
jgi:phage terminase large subunit-like protein